MLASPETAAVRRRAVEVEPQAHLRVDQLDAVLAVAHVMAAVEQAHVQAADLLGRDARRGQHGSAVVNVVSIGTDVLLHLAARDAVQVGAALVAAAAAARLNLALTTDPLAVFCMAPIGGVCGLLRRGELKGWMMSVCLPCLELESRWNPRCRTRLRLRLGQAGLGGYCRAEVGRSLDG